MVKDSAERDFPDQLSHLNYLNEDTDMEILNELLDNYNLTPEQLDAVKYSFLTPTASAIESIEMGLGKTIISLGLLQMISTSLDDKVAIVVAPTNTIENFYRDIVNNTRLRTMTSTGQYADVIKAIDSIERNLIDCLVVTPSAWTLSEEFNLFIFNNPDKIICYIWDECKGDTDKGFNHFIEAGHRTPFVYPLNATITGQGVSNIYKMLYVCSALDMTEREFIRKYGDYTMTRDNNRIYNIDWGLIKKDYGDYFINLNREDVGADTVYSRVMFHRCSVTTEQREFLKESTSREVLYAPVDSKGNQLNIPPTSVPAIAKLIQTVMGYGPEDNTLIYCRNIVPANTLYNLLKGLGYKVFRIDGHTTPTSELKMKSEEEYNKSKGAIMITSISEGSNLNSTDHVIIYQNPSEVIQYVARAVRGFKSKEITLDWIYYPELEMESFMKNIENAINVSVGSNRRIELLEIMLKEVYEVYPNEERLGIFANKILEYNL